MALYLFVPTSEIGNFADGLMPPQICSMSNTATITVDLVEYTRITDIETLDLCFEQPSSNVTQKQIRDCIKTQAPDFDILTTTQKLICAALNIGTGAQILATYPNFLDRVQNSFEFIKIMRGYPHGEAKLKAFYITAMVFAVCKHVEFGATAMPEVILTFLNCNQANWGVTIEGSDYLKMYVTDQVQGYYKGDNTTGLYDFFAGTALSKYAAGGLPAIFVDNALNPLQVTAAQWIEGGFDSAADFSAYCLAYLDSGILQPN